MFKVPKGITYVIGGRWKLFLPKFGIVTDLGETVDKTVFLMHHNGIPDSQEFNDHVFSIINTNEPKPPEELVLNSVSVCAGECDYCYKKTDLVGSRRLKFADIEQYLTPNIERISVMGGEPLLNIELIADLLEKTDLPIAVSTGLFVTDYTFNRFMGIVAENAKRMHVQISIDPHGGFRKGLMAHEVLSRAATLISTQDLSTNIRCTLCRGAVDYWTLRSDLEAITGKEVDCEFEFVSDPELLPTMQEWELVTKHLIEDVNSFFFGKRKIVPLEVLTTAEILLDTFRKQETGWNLEMGCGTYRGSAVIIEADGRLTKCCMPFDQHTSSSGKCRTCPMLRTCGMKCFVKAGEDFQCMTSTTKTIAAVYAALRRIDGPLSIFD